MRIQIILILALCTTGSANLNAELVTIEFDRLSTVSSSGTMVKDFDNINATSGSPVTIGFTVSGLSIDGVGAADDSISFSFSASGTGSDASGVAAPDGFGFATQGVTSNLWGVNSNGSSELATAFDAAGESMTWNLDTSSVMLGAGATETGNVTFVGFTGFDLAAFTAGGNDRYNLSGTSSDGIGLGPANDPATFDPTSSFTLAHNSGAFRIADINATFETSIGAIPEPNSFAMFGIAVAFVVPRRGKAK